MNVASRGQPDSVPETAPVVLLLVDVISDLEFPGNGSLLRSARAMARQLAALKRGANARGCPAIYVNDNFGRWRSDFKKLVRRCVEDGVRGSRVAKLLQPTEQDYFVLKPEHSGFFSTSLEVLLEHLKAHTLIITGIATNICVQFTANDAYLRGYRIVMPTDCVAANTTRLSRSALVQMRTVLKASTPTSTSIRWNDLIASAEKL